MNTKIAAFSHKGVLIAQRLKTELNLSDKDLSFFNKEDFSGNDLHLWVKESFGSAERLIFIGALQIAVRLISKELKSKLTDPAVVVIDDNARYCIPVLSGHIGGANEFAAYLSGILNSEAVITTSTDINNKFAIDVFARKNDLIIKNPSKIKEVSSKLLGGESIGIFSYVKLEGKLPDNVFMADEETADAVISPFKSQNENALVLIPKAITLGCGCKSGTDKDKMQNCYNEFIDKTGLYKESVLNMATIDLKKNEEAVLSLSEKEKLPVSFFSAEELMSVQGDFTSSQFVKSITGVDNVCERSAEMLSDGEILVRKTIYSGITFALGINNKHIKIGD